MTTCIFDAYGTLFDVAAAARIAASEPDYAALAPVWPSLAEHWRQKQLQYTWLRAVTGDHTDFWTVTCDALDWTLEKLGLQDNAALRDRLLALYRELQAYPEVPDMLRALKEAGHTTGILSNGSPDMLQAAADSAGITPLLDHIISVEEVGIFKPAAQVYDLIETHTGAAPDKVLFVSSNGWDAAAAAHYGCHTAWANRAGDPVDRLPGRPDNILSDLSSIPQLAEAL